MTQIIDVREKSSEGIPSIMAHNTKNRQQDRTYC